MIQKHPILKQAMKLDYNENSIYGRYLCIAPDLVAEIPA